MDISVPMVEAVESRGLASAKVQRQETIFREQPVVWFG